MRSQEEFSDETMIILRRSYFLFPTFIYPIVLFSILLGFKWFLMFSSTPLAIAFSCKRSLNYLQDFLRTEYIGLSLRACGWPYAI